MTLLSAFLLTSLLASSASAGAKVEIAPAEGRPVIGTGGPGGNAGGVLAVKHELVPAISLTAALNKAPTPVTHGTLLPPSVAPAASPANEDARPTALEAAQLIAGEGAGPRDEVSSEKASAQGTTRFDGAQDRSAASYVEVPGSQGTHFVRLAPSRPSEERPAPAQRWRRLALETAEVGVLALGWQLFAAILYSFTAAHSAHPILAGALWALGASEMIKALANIRGRVTGGWQASHDQKMRHDYATGQLKDIRGRPYGKDRYDVWSPGATAGRARTLIDLTAVGMGLPWFINGGAGPIALYLATAFTLIAARRVLSARAAAPAAGNGKPFEYDR